MAGNQEASFSLALSAVGSNREEADNYRRIVAILNEDWRVIECRDGIQWILQHRSGERHGQPRWVSKKFNRCKEALLANVHDFVGEMEPSVWMALCGLPDWFGGKP
ncbi:hypothetical protein [Hoeflea sp.]|uniref:hypothetical protein n=1 Tax=Hoeflea sp. TaxID=1940281 RepID=UPI003A8DD10A